MKPIRVLAVFREPIEFGGQERYVSLMEENMDPEVVQIDWFTPFTCTNQELKEKMEARGSRFFIGNHPFGKNNNEVFDRELKKVLKDNHFDIVHVQSGSTYALMSGLKLAAKAGVPVRIAHSHCTGNDDLRHALIKAYSAREFEKYATALAACSLKAAQWKFPSKLVKNGQVHLFKNGIDLDKFSFDPKKRDEIREKMGVKGKIVLGHVGRFSTQKNHDYLLEIFEAFHIKHPSSVLWLCGDGELRGQIEKKIEDLGLKDSVVLFGVRDDVSDLMQAMDVLVLPSLFEGLPIVAVEAQAEGLPVCASDNITKELPDPDLAVYLPLDKGRIYPWVAAIEKLIEIKREDGTSKLREAGYDVKEAAKKLQEFYCSCL